MRDLDAIFLEKRITELERNGGGGGGGHTVKIEKLFEGNGDVNVTLSKPYTDYDLLVLDGTVPDNYLLTSSYMVSSIEIDKIIGINSESRVTWYTVNDSTHLTRSYADNCKLNHIYGIKF